MIIVSACLLGECCRYDGGSCYHEKVVAYLQGKAYIKVCPEQLGGLSTPRPPSEIRGAKVYSIEGEDVSAAFYAGAEKVKQLAQKQACELAILKSESPSCGCGLVYDGNFDGTLIAGDGITAATLKKSGIKVISEQEI